jgi:hypothetical protein
MYAVVGCNRCSAFWIVEGRPETTGCPRCRKTHQFRKLKQFATADTPEAAREARARILAARSDNPRTIDDWASEEREAMATGVSAEEFMEASGLDADAVEAAGERAMQSGAGRSRSRKQVVLDALDELDEPTEERVLAYATDAGVPADYVERALEKLLRAGEVSESGGTYRRL